MWLGIKRELMIGGIRICRCERQQQSVYYELEEGQAWDKTELEAGPFLHPSSGTSTMA